MIVVAIIGILATLALPAYEDYTMRAKVAEAITFAGKCKTVISEFNQANKHPGWNRFGCEGPFQADGRNIDESKDLSTYVKFIHVHDPAAVEIKTNIKNKDGQPIGLYLIPVKDAAGKEKFTSIEDFEKNLIKGWKCGYLRDSGYADNVQNWLPSECRNGLYDVYIETWEPLP